MYPLSLVHCRYLTIFLMVISCTLLDLLENLAHWCDAKASSGLEEDVMQMIITTTFL
jgi:hypothetical protein